MLVTFYIFWYICMFFFAIGIGAHAMEDTPATPPGMWVLTRRFESLRSCESEYAHSVQESDCQHIVQQHRAVRPRGAYHEKSPGFQMLGI